MAPDFVIQLALLLLTLAIFFSIHKLSKHAFTRIRTKNRTSIQANRHFLHGTHLLDRVRSTTNKAQSLALAKSALTEAERAISLSPKDPGPHILKALALDFTDRKRSALRSLDLALSWPRVKSLTERERVDALVKRVELKLAVNRRRRVDSAVEDLVEAVRLSRGENSRAHCLLGQCYEWKGMREEAKRAFEDALRVEPGSVVARDGLGRLGVVN